VIIFETVAVTLKPVAVSVNGGGGISSALINR
jgi:hypothetical protein